MTSKALKTKFNIERKKTLEKQFERPYVACAFKNLFSLTNQPIKCYTQYTNCEIVTNNFYHKVQN